MNAKRDEAGLTVIELLVVCAILATLAAILFPVTRAVNIRAMATQSSHNLRQLTLANIAYATDNDQFAPVDDYWNNRRWCGARTSASQPYDPTKGFLANYLGKSRQVTPCPLFTRMLAEQGAKESSFEQGSGGYGYNDYVGGGIASNYTNDAQRVRIALIRTRLERAATTIMFATTAYARTEGVQEYPFFHPPYWTDEYGNVQESFGRPSPSLHFRFGGKALVSWCDGHVSFEKRDARTPGTNPHGGDADKQNLGWFGPDRENGYWNPFREE